MSLSLPTNSLTGWTITGNVNSNGTSINVISSGVASPAANTIGTFLGVSGATFISVTNGAAVKYGTTITVPSNATLTFTWAITGGDVGSSFYNDKAYLTISGHSVPSSNGTFLIASTTTVPTSGTYTRSIAAGTFTIGFASFNSVDTAVDLILTFSNVLFTFGPAPAPSPAPSGADIINLQGPGVLYGDSYTNVSLPLVVSMTGGDCFNVFPFQDSQPVPLGYRYYRWQITDLKNFSSANSVQVSEFVFQVGGSDQSMAGVLVTNPSGDNPSGEGSQNLVDNSFSTKWLDFNIKSFNVSNVIFDFGTSRTFNGYRWATANDSDDRDPRSWTVSGSNDTSTWTLLHTVVGFTSTATRLEWQTAQTY
jgi:hypothetical protein